MDHEATTIGPKTHPAAREMLPDDPLRLHGCEVAGDHELMLRLMVEEYARLGWGTDAMLRLARDPNYVGFHGLLRLYGEAGLRERIAKVVSRTGVLRVTEYEAPREPAAEELVQITSGAAAGVHALACAHSLKAELQHRRDCHA
jgi:hypothetical protein